MPRRMQGVYGATLALWRARACGEEKCCQLWALTHGPRRSRGGRSCGVAARIRLQFWHACTRMPSHRGAQGGAEPALWIAAHEMALCALPALHTKRRPAALAESEAQLRGAPRSCAHTGPRTQPGARAWGAGSGTSHHLITGPAARGGRLQVRVEIHSACAPHWGPGAIGAHGAGGGAGRQRARPKDRRHTSALQQRRETLRRGLRNPPAQRRPRVRGASRGRARSRVRVPANFPLSPPPRCARPPRLSGASDWHHELLGIGTTN